MVLKYATVLPLSGTWFVTLCGVGLQRSLGSACWCPQGSLKCSQGFLKPQRHQRSISLTSPPFEPLISKNCIEFQDVLRISSRTMKILDLFDHHRPSPSRDFIIHHPSFRSCGPNQPLHIFDTVWCCIYISCFNSMFSKCRFAPFQWRWGHQLSLALVPSKRGWAVW